MIVQQNHYKLAVLLRVAVLVRRRADSERLLNSGPCIVDKLADVEQHLTKKACFLSNRDIGVPQSYIQARIFHIFDPELEVLVESRIRCLPDGRRHLRRLPLRHRRLGLGVRRVRVQDAQTHERRRRRAAGRLETLGRHQGDLQ